MPTHISSSSLPLTPAFAAPQWSFCLNIIIATTKCTETATQSWLYFSLGGAVPRHSCLDRDKRPCGGKPRTRYTTSASMLFSMAAYLKKTQLEVTSNCFLGTLAWVAASVGCGMVDSLAQTGPRRQCLSRTTHCLANCGVPSGHLIRHKHARQLKGRTSRGRRTLGHRPQDCYLRPLSTS